MRTISRLVAVTALAAATTPGADRDASPPCTGAAATLDGSRPTPHGGKPQLLGGQLQPLGGKPSTAAVAEA
jgi:hypothetical protein